MNKDSSLRNAYNAYKPIFNGIILQYLNNETFNSYFKPYVKLP